MDDDRPPIFRLTQWAAEKMHGFRAAGADADADSDPADKPARWELWAMISLTVILAVAALTTQID